MEVVTEFSTMTIIYMHSSPSDVSTWLHGFSLPNCTSLPVYKVNENQVRRQLSVINGPTSAEWMTPLLATHQQCHPSIQCVIEWEKKLCIFGTSLRDFTKHSLFIQLQ
jgi:hypothetical protein